MKATAGYENNQPHSDDSHPVRLPTHDSSGGADCGFGVGAAGGVAAAAFCTGGAMGAGVEAVTGAGEAGALPNTARILATWFPVERRGFSQGMINTSALVGGAVAPIAATYLIGEAGWRLTEDGDNVSRPVDLGRQAGELDATPDRSFEPT